MSFVDRTMQRGCASCGRAGTVRHLVGTTCERFPEGWFFWQDWEEGNIPVLLCSEECVLAEQRRRDAAPPPPSTLEMIARDLIDAIRQRSKRSR